MAARLIAVPAAAALQIGAAVAPGSQPWLVVGLVFFGVAAVGMLAAVGIKMRRTPKPPQQHPPAASGAGADAERDPGDGGEPDGDAAAGERTP